MTRGVMRIPTPSRLLFTPGGLALSDFEKAETLADRKEALFQPVNDPSVPAVIEVVNEVMRTYSLAHTTEVKLANPTDVQQTMRDFKVGKALGANGVPNMASLKHLPLSTVSILLALFNMIFRIQYFLLTLKQAHVFPS
jgi:hypothetical protein